MSTIKTRTRADESGNVCIPIGVANAGRVVDVTIDLAGASPAKPVREMSSEEYREFLRRFIGSSPNFPDADGLLSADHVRRAASRGA